jgi:hypothetical protein
VRQGTFVALSCLWLASCGSSSPPPPPPGSLDGTFGAAGVAEVDLAADVG